MTTARARLEGPGVKARQRRELLRALVGLDLANRSDVSEAFTNADTFTIEFEPGFTDGRLRAHLAAATFLLDLVRFEEKDKDVVDQLEGKSKEPALDD